MREAIWLFAGVKLMNLFVVLLLNEGNSVDSEEVAKALQSGDVPPPVVVEAENGMPEKVVITYISRQSARERKLLKEDHEALGKELRTLVARTNAEKEEGGS